MSGPQYVGDPACCGSAVEPNIVFVPVPYSYTCCYSILPQNETIVHQPKTKTPYDELVDSFVQSNLKALEKSSMKYPKEDNIIPKSKALEKTSINFPKEYNKTPISRQPLMETSVKQSKQEMYPVKEQSNKSFSNKNIENPDCNLTNNEYTKSVNSPSWASNYLQKIGQPDQKGIKINLKPKKPSQREEKLTSSSVMKTPEKTPIESSQKTNNTIDIFAPIRPKLKFVIPKLNQPKKESNMAIKSLQCESYSNKEMAIDKNTITAPGTSTKSTNALPKDISKEKNKVTNISPGTELPNALPKEISKENKTIKTVSAGSITKLTNTLPKEITKENITIKTVSAGSSSKLTNALPKEITKENNAIKIVSAGSSTKLTNALPKENNAIKIVSAGSSTKSTNALFKEFPKEKHTKTILKGTFTKLPKEIIKENNTVSGVSTETNRKLNNSLPNEITIKKNKVTIKSSGSFAKIPKASPNNPKLSVERLRPALKEKTIKTSNTSPSKNKHCKNNVNKSKTVRVISSNISKINKKYTGFSLDTDKNEVNVKETKHKTKEIIVPKTSKSDIKLEKKSSPIRNVSKVKSKSSTSYKEIKYDSQYFYKNTTENILMDQKLSKVKYINSPKMSAMHDKYGSAKSSHYESKKEVLKKLRLKQEALCENLSYSFTKGTDDIFDLRQKLDKKEICRKIQELENTQNEIKEYLQKNVYDNLSQKLNNNEKEIASASLNTNIKPKEPGVKEIKLLIKIIHEDQTKCSAVEPSIKNETNDDLDFLNDFNVDEVVNYLNECEDKSNKTNESSATDVNDNIEEKLELLFKESTLDNLENKEICNKNLEIRKEITLERNMPKEIGSKVSIDEPMVLDANENLLSHIKIEPELELTENTGEKCLENITANMPVEEIPTTTNSNCVSIIMENFGKDIYLSKTGANNNLDHKSIKQHIVRNDIIQTEPDDRNNIQTINDVEKDSESTSTSLTHTENSLHQEMKSNETLKEEKITTNEEICLNRKKICNKHHIVENNITQTEPNDQNNIQTSIDIENEKDSESTTISLPNTENSSEQEIKPNETLKEEKMTINEEISEIIKATEEPNVIKDSIQIKQKENVPVTPTDVKVEGSDKNNVIKPVAEVKTLKRKCNDTSSTSNHIESDISCNNTLRPQDRIFAQSLQSTISGYFEKTLKATILSVIHKGQFSTIFKCKNSDDVNYAAKVSNNKNPKLINKFIKQEAMIKAFQKDIPTENLNCVYLVNGFVVDQRWGLLMEYYPYNLLQFINEKKQRFNVKQLQNLARQLVGAVITLRNRHIVHSDIKPSHILLNAAGDQLKLCGFDSAYYIYPPALLPNIGTVNYRAPEVIIGYSADFSIDVWSTAVVLYEMVTGYKLFPGIYNNDILFKQMSTLGNIPMNMLVNSSFTDSHFRGTIFLRKVGYMGQKTVLIQSFFKSERLSSTIFKEYTKQWGPSVPKARQDREISKLRSFVKLLEQMLIMHPKHRLAIEFVYASPFIHETFE